MSEKRISRDEAVKRARGLLLVLAKDMADGMPSAEDLVKAIGAWEEEDKPPELPEGWLVYEGADYDIRMNLFIPSEYPDGAAWNFSTNLASRQLPGFRAFLARALAALRQDDGEDVELMVPLEDFYEGRPPPAGNLQPEGYRWCREHAVRARRVRP